MIYVLDLVSRNRGSVETTGGTRRVYGSSFYNATNLRISSTADAIEPDPSSAIEPALNVTRAESRRREDFTTANAIMRSSDDRRSRTVGIREIFLFHDRRCAVRKILSTRQKEMNLKPHRSMSRLIYHHITYRYLRIAPFD